MDNDPIRKIPLRQQASPTDDTAKTLPPYIRGAFKSFENPQGAPLQERTIPASEQPVLEYEQVWDRPTQHLPLAPESSFPKPPLPPKKTGQRWPIWGRVLATIFLLLFLLGGGALAFGYYYFQANIQKPLANFIHPVSRGNDEPSNNSIPSDSSVTGRAWNILLLGSDNDGKYSFPALLTQVMMVVHVDTINNKVTLLSIPRDSWVNVPDVGGMHKIDQAFFLGAAHSNNFDDGVRVARLTIEKDFTHPIVDDSYPDDTGAHPNDPFAYKRLYIAPGPQHMNGLQALEYVRSRHADLVGDIGRTQRQQQVLTALRQKLNVESVLGHLQQLIADLQGKVYTDLSEQEMLGFASFGRNLPGNAISRVTLGPGSGRQDFGDYGTVYDPAAGSNQDVVLPHCENIQPLINNIFGLGDAQSCNING